MLYLVLQHQAYGQGIHCLIGGISEIESGIRELALQVPAYDTIWNVKFFEEEQRCSATYLTLRWQVGDIHPGSTMNLAKDVTPASE